MLRLRASRAPLAFQCPAALHSTGILVDETNDAATLGTAAHTLLAELARAGEIPWDRVPETAQQYGVDSDELRMLCAMGRKLWEAVRESFPAPLVEVPLSAEIAGVLLTGHADLISVSESVARVGDWKTGRKDTDYREQLAAYATLVLLDNPELEECTATILWVRDGEIENYTLTRESMRDWLARVESQVAQWDGVYRPGPHCRYCPCSHECAAANALARRDVAALLNVDVAAELALMPPAQIIALHQRAANVASIAYRVREAIREHVRANGAIVADGHQLTITEQQKRQLRPAEAWSVLEAAGFSDEDFAACVKLSVTKVEDRVAKKAPPRKGAAAKRALAAELEQANAIEWKTEERLALKRA
jgi:hypothetical protein